MKSELYRFDENGTITTFTSSSRSVVHSGETYVPVAMGRKNITVTSELSKADITVSITINNSVAQRWLTTVLDETVLLTIFEKKGNNTPTVIWKGRLATVKPDLKQINLVFDSIFTALKIPGLRRRYQRSCPHVLYGKGCLLDKANFATAGTITATDGLVLTIPAAALEVDGFYSSGILDDSGGKSRFITNHVGDQITLVRELAGLLVSPAVILHAGCDRTLSICDTKFSNSLNFGGMPFIPIKNPFGGSSIA